MIPRFCWKARLGALVCLCLLAGPRQGSAQQFTQFFTVDCSNPSAQYPTISSALAAAGNNSYIYVTAGNTCTENVTVGYLTNIAISTDWMQTFSVTGNLAIQSSHTVQVQGMVVSNPYGDGIDVNNSSDVSLTFVQSVGNKGMGLDITTSDVTIGGAGTFSNNGGIGINAGSNSFLAIEGWEVGGNVDVSNNMGVGINLDRSVMMHFGPTTITNTHAVPGGTSPTGFGIAEYGGAKAGLFALFGPVSVASNDGGGILLWETSEMSTGGNISWAPYLETIQGNGPFGIASEYAGNLTVIGGVTISDHTNAGISLYGNSEANIFNSNQIVHNGTGTDPDRAGIFVDNGSQTFVSSASIQNNGGPGILGLVHATLNVEASTFSSNAGGAIVCDGSTALQTDLLPSVLGAANTCKVSPVAIHHPHGPGDLGLSLPDWKSMKARSLRLGQLAILRRGAAAPLAK